MNFELPEDLQILQNTLRAFGETKIAPKARAWDRDETFPREVVRELGELGVMGVTVPEAYGGAAMNYLAMSVVIEEIARFDGSLALTVASHNGLCSNHIKMFGSEALKARFLPDLAAGKTLGAWGLSEAHSGSDAAGLKTTAVRKGDGWIISGAKMWITQGTVGDVFVVLANTSPEKKQKGITAFVIEKDAPGFTRNPIHGKLGMRSSDTAELVFDEVKVPDAQRIGEVDHGFIDTLQILDRGRITIGALAVGLGRGAIEESLRYANEREAFGKPIAAFQAIQWKLADMATEIDAARLLVRRAATLCDAGKPFGIEASKGKLFASEAATRAASEAIQIHGGYGYTSDFPVERMWRDAKLCEIGEGTSEVQRMVIARSILAA